jgi:hypothetical protein
MLPPTVETLPHNKEGWSLYAVVLLLGGLFTAWDVLAFWILGIAFVLFLLAATLDLMMRAAMWEQKAYGSFPWRECVKDKYLMLILVIFSMVLDLTVYTVFRYTGVEVAVLQEGWFFITMASLLWFIGFQGIEMLGLYAKSGRVAPPHIGYAASMVAKFYRAIRKVDEARWRETHDDGTAPPDRWIDKLLAQMEAGELTEEEVAIVLQEVSRRKIEDIPSDPTDVLDEVNGEEQ